MMFVRAPRQEWDEMGSPEWTYERCLRAFRALETYEPGWRSGVGAPVDACAEEECSRDTARYRGSDGPLRVTSARAFERYPRVPLRFDSRFLTTYCLT